MSERSRIPPPPGPVPSPCTNVCVLDAGSRLCTGCLRHIDEIVAWGSMDDDARRAVLERVAARRGAPPPQNTNANCTPR
jgi:predicted Fe-S protein YdhL (DUF1289 family)